MKRKTFFKALVGLIVAPTLLVKGIEPKKGGWINKENHVEHLIAHNTFYATTNIGKGDDAIINLLTEEIKTAEKDLMNDLYKRYVW